MKFAIFGNTYQAKKSSHAKELFRLLEKHRAELYICRDFYHFLTNDLKLEIKDATLLMEIISKPTWSSVSVVTVPS
jgi:NAD+ kinase